MMIAIFIPVLIIAVCLQLSLTVEGFARYNGGLMKRSISLSVVLSRRLNLKSSTLTPFMLSGHTEDAPVFNKRCTNENEQTVVEKLANPADISLLERERMQFNGADVRVGIITTRHNKAISNDLLKGVNESLLETGVLPSNVFTTSVPSPYDLPITAKLLAASKRVDVIIALGCLTQEDKSIQFETTASIVAHGLMQVSLDTLIPCIYGILTAPSLAQAMAISTGAINPGFQWGKNAVEMGLNRMAAMGLDKKSSNNSNLSVPLVTFQSLLPAAAKCVTKETKKFGF